MERSVKMIVIGGSWGGIQASLAILTAIPHNYNIPIVLVLHRMKNSASDLHEILNRKVSPTVQEVEEKETPKAGYVYLAPPNYHVLFERDGTFSLDVSELENYSRPSIDVTFTSAAQTFGPDVVGIILSGANKDGSAGLKEIADRGGIAIVQEPKEAEVAIMPEAAIALVSACKIYTIEKIREFLLSLDDH